MLLNSYKSQPKISYLESVAKASDAKSTTTDVLSNVPKWTRSTGNFDKIHGFSDNEYARCVNHLNNTDSSDKENVIELPNAVVEAFYQKLTATAENQNTDLPLSPKNRNEGQKKRRPKSSDHNQEVMDRLYMSPSPFQSPDDLRKCYLTEKGKKRLHSAVCVKIPKKTLYVIDKVVRKKLRKTIGKNMKDYFTQNARLMFGNKLNKHTFSPLSNEENMLQETRDNLNFMTPEKQTLGNSMPATASQR